MSAPLLPTLLRSIRPHIQKPLISPLFTRSTTARLPLLTTRTFTSTTTTRQNTTPTTSNVLVRLLGQLLPSALLETAEDELRLERPLERDVPGLAGLLVGQRAVVLQVGAEAFGLKGGPGGELVHGRGVLGPVGELVGVLGELGLEGLDGGGVFVEEDLRVEESVEWVA